MTREFHTHVDFKNNDLTNVDSVSFNTSTSDAPNAASKVVWDNGEGTLAYGLKGGTLDLNIGSEQVALCTNNTGSTIAKGKVVYINGASGNRPTIALADADADATSAQTFGVTAEDIANGAEGFVCTYGILKNIDTSAFTAGQILYLSSTAGGFTATKPSAPVHLVYVGYVISVNASSGRIFVKPQNGYELEELHDVSITSVQPNDLLAYDSSSTLWKNKSASTLNIVQSTIVDAKGDIIAGTANDTVSRLAVGADGTVLTADSTTGTGLKWATATGGTPPYLPHITGQDYAIIPNNTAFANMNVTTNRTYYTPFYVPKTKTYVNMRFLSASTFSGTATVRLGIYNDTNGKPDTVKLDAGTVSVTAANQGVDITISQSLDQGWYWIAWNQQAAPTTGTYIGHPSGTVLNTIYGTPSTPSGTVAGAAQNIGWIQDSVTGAFATATSLSKAQAVIVWMRP